MGGKAQSTNNLSHKRWQREAVLCRAYVLRNCPQTFKRIQRKVKKEFELRFAAIPQGGG